jgi:Flp pilus assembly protein TadG
MRRVQTELIDGSRARTAHAPDRKPTNIRRAPLLRRLLAEQSGQVLPWVAVVMIVCLMMGGLIVDLAHAMVIRRQLQASTDAAALAAAGTLPNTTYSTVGQTYSAASGGRNQLPGVSTGNPTITPLCLTTIGIDCSANNPNAVRVTETATISTYFARIFGVRNVTVSTTSTAASKGAGSLPYNVAIIVDSTLSMNAIDTYCNNKTQEQCALSGVLEMLGYQGNGQYGLSPSVDHVALFTFPNIASGSSSGVEVGGTYNCTTTMPSQYQGSRYSYDRSGGYYYSMLGAEQSTDKHGNVQWSGSNNIPWTGVAWAEPYTFPPIGATSYIPPSGTLGPTYQVVGFSNDFRTSDAATTLNQRSNLVMAAGGVPNCGGLQPSNYDGNYGTYYAGAIYAAQSALLAEQAANPGTSNVMIILGDGNSTAPSSSSSPDSQSPAMPNTATQSTSTYQTTSQLTTTAYTLPSTYNLASNAGIYPSWVGECGQAVDAAQYAATYPNNPTRVYTVAYGASTQSSYSNCASDIHAGTHPNITPCQTMKSMATGPAYFYSDYTVPDGDRGCVATNNALTSLSDIFKAITADLTRVRLIPNNTQ